MVNGVVINATARTGVNLCSLNSPVQFFWYYSGKGGKNRRRGKGDGEESKRELEFKEDGAFILKMS